MSQQTVRLVQQVKSLEDKVREQESAIASLTEAVSTLQQQRKPGRKPNVKTQ